ncbi:DUF503 domain-containing protein [Thermoleophilia bacterium SCSIO 60948]|nr:DUF503 domain-containing protein [Thermoleophilia bacterium SCSIO 60948]
MNAFVCLIEARLRLADSHDLKAKRKHVKSVKERLRARLGAAVAEIEGHDAWQSATLLVAVVGEGSEIEARADAAERLIESRFPDGCSFERTLRSLEDLRD